MKPGSPARAALAARPRPVSSIPPHHTAAPDARQNPRTQTITDMAFVNGNVMVAGMSNEEWSSALRSIPYPFKTAGKGTQLQIWHASHGRYETQSPVRTFVSYKIKGEPYLLAAYRDGARAQRHQCRLDVQC